MSELRLLVSAAADASILAVFRSVVAEGIRAAKQMSAAFGKATSETAKGAKDRGDVVVAQAARGAKAEADAARASIEIEKQKSKIKADLAKQEQDMRNRDHKRFLDELKEQEKEAKKFARSASKERTEADRATKKREAVNERVGSAAMRTFGGYMSAGLGVARSVAGGAGIDLSLGGNMGRARALQSEAGDATRSAFTAKGQIATAEDVKRTVDAIRSGGDAAKMAYGDISAGLNAFVAKSADLETGKAVIGKMGMLARATGADVGDLLAAAGDVNRELDDGPDRAERLMSIMRLVAKQGAMGNLEVKDLAKYMGRVSSTAFMYAGDRDANIGILGALAQVSMKGGQSTAPEATRSAAAFARDLTKSAALTRFQEAGIEVFANKEKTALRGPEAIITDFLAKSKGNFAELAKLFQNQSSRAVVLGFENIYKQAGGGDKGIEAVRNEFKRYTTTMSEGDVNAQAKTSLEGDAAKAQAIQNRLETMASKFTADVLPSMEKLAPNAEGAARALANIVSFGAQNPGTMIVGAIAASIAKAQIAEHIGPAISKAIGGLGMGGGLAITAAAVTLLATQAIFDAKDSAATRKVNADLGGELADTIAKGASKTGMVTAEDKAAFQEQLEKLRSRVAAAKNEQELMRLGANPEVRAAKNFIFGGPDLASIYQNREDAKNLPELEKQLSDLEGRKEAVLGAKVENVEAIAAAIGAAVGRAVKENMPPPAGGAPGAPGVDQGARSGGVN